MLFTGTGHRAGTARRPVSPVQSRGGEDLLSPSAGSDQPKAAQQPAGLVTGAHWWLVVTRTPGCSSAKLLSQGAECLWKAAEGD